MQSILDAINEWIKEILIGAINGNLSTMFGDVNEKVGTIAAEVGKTPQGWNAGIFSMIQSLSENVIVPIAGLVITYVLCVELISMVTEKNNMHDMPHIRFHDLRHTAATNMHQLTGDFYTVGEVLGHTLAGIGASLGLSMNFEAVTARYVDVRLERKKEVLDAYHSAVEKAAPEKPKEAEPKKGKRAAKKKHSEIDL